jgi:hypothetical protein
MLPSKDIYVRTHVYLTHRYEPTVGDHYRGLLNYLYISVEKAGTRVRLLVRNGNDKFVLRSSVTE